MDPSVRKVIVAARELSAELKERKNLHARLLRETFLLTEQLFLQRLRFEELREKFVPGGVRGSGREGQLLPEPGSSGAAR